MIEQQANGGDTVTVPHLPFPIVYLNAYSRAIHVPVLNIRLISNY